MDWRDHAGIMIGKNVTSGADVPFVFAKGGSVIVTLGAVLATVANVNFFK